MFLQKLCLENFRNFSFIDINFNDGINLITGSNGQGKTNILESIYYSALTKSFRTIKDKNAIKYNKDFFNIKSIFLLQPVRKNNIRIYYSEKEGKILFINEKKITKFSEFIGKIPCVLLTLDDLKLCYGGPNERRKFLDVLLSQVSPTYLDSLKNYKRCLAQRNFLLTNDNRRYTQSQIEIWNKQFVKYGSEIIQKRIFFIDYLNENINSYYQKFCSSKEELNVLYKTNIFKKEITKDIDKINSIFEKKISKFFNYEYDKGISILGPHRDDIEFYLNDKSLKEFSSQGENKTFVIALKFLEWEYISENKKTKPILLLDDVFGELDQSRKNGLIKFFEKIGQTFITTTSENKFDELINKKFMVKNSEIYDV